MTAFGSPFTAGSGFPFGILVTVQRQTEDRFGNFTTVSEHTVGPCALENTGGSGRPSSREEGANAGSDVVTRIAVLYMPSTADIQPDDRIVLPNGSRWLVVGDIADFVNPFTGWHPGISVQIQRVTG